MQETAQARPFLINLHHSSLLFFAPLWQFIISFDPLRLSLTVCLFLQTFAIYIGFMKWLEYYSALYGIIMCLFYCKSSCFCLLLSFYCYLNCIYLALIFSAKEGHLLRPINESAHFLLEFKNRRQRVQIVLKQFKRIQQFLPMDDTLDSIYDFQQQFLAEGQQAEKLSMMMLIVIRDQYERQGWIGPDAYRNALNLVKNETTQLFKRFLNQLSHNPKSFLEFLPPYDGFEQLQTYRGRSPLRQYLVSGKYETDLSKKKVQMESNGSAYISPFQASPQIPGQYNTQTQPQYVQPVYPSPYVQPINSPQYVQPNYLPQNAWPIYPSHNLQPIYSYQNAQFIHPYQYGQLLCPPQYGQFIYQPQGQLSYQLQQSPVGYQAVNQPQQGLVSYLHQHHPVQQSQAQKKPNVVFQVSNSAFYDRFKDTINRRK